MKLFFALAVAVSTGFYFSCKQRPPSHQKAVVSEEQFKRSHQILSNLLKDKNNYIPFEYKPDGCYARALYLAMELGAEKIPSSSIYAFQKPDEDLYLQLNGSNAWWYHAAPMITKYKTEKIPEPSKPSPAPERSLDLNNSTNSSSPSAVEPAPHPHEADVEEATILDPAMELGTHLTISDWLAKMNVTLNDILLFRIAGSEYKTKVIADRKKGNLRWDPMISNFQKMKPFQLEDIQDACQVLHNYLQEDPSFGIGTVARRMILYERTAYLVQALAKLQKLDGSLPDDLLDCAGASINVSTGSIRLTPDYSTSSTKVFCTYTAPLMGAVPSLISTLNIRPASNANDEFDVWYSTLTLFVTGDSPTYRIKDQALKGYLKELQNEDLSDKRLAEFMNTVVKPQSKGAWQITRCVIPKRTD